MNPSTFIGIVASVLLLRVVLFFSTETPPIFIDLPGLGIVLIRTLVATFISCSLKEVMRNEWVYAQQNIDELVPISRIWMTGDVQKVERVQSRYAHRPKSHRSRHENRAVLCAVTGGTFSRDVEKSLKAGY